jgi:hypothetical protein
MIKIKSAIAAAQATKAAVLAKGATAVVAMEVVSNEVNIPDLGQIETIVKLALEILISIGTLWSMIKKPKPRKDSPL